MVAMSLSAFMPPPIYIGCVTIMPATYIFFVFVRNPRRIVSPILLPAWDSGVVIPPKTSANRWATWAEMKPCCCSWPMVWPIWLPTWPTVVDPNEERVCFCLSFRSDISRDRCSYPAIPVTRGRYLVLAALCVSSAIWAVNLDIASCLLLANASSRQRFNDSTLRLSAITSWLSAVPFSILSAAVSCVIAVFSCAIEVCALCFSPIVSCAIEGCISSLLSGFSCIIEAISCEKTKLTALKNMLKNNVRFIIKFYSISNTAIF